MTKLTDLTLADNEIHLWICRPNGLKNPDLLYHYDKLINDIERTKQQRYKFEKDQHSALITRALVRTVLSKYAPLAPSQWQFTLGEKDKPEILPPKDVQIPPLRFNISHTHDFIVCGVTLEKDLGVDVEYCDRKTDLLGICDRYFSPTEVNELNNLAKENQRSRFFDYWTLKESYIKACGLGLSIPLDHFSFHIKDASQDQLTPDIDISFAPQRNDNPDHWQFWLTYPSDTHRLSVAIRSIEKKDYKLKLFTTIPLMSDTEINFPL